MQLYVQSSVVEKGVTPDEYRYTRFDVVAGTVFAGVVAVFIIVATAATLFPRGLHVDTAADAARALEPVAGAYARLLFALGLLGASLLAAGVLPLATTYMMSEALGFERGVSRSWSEAPVFMGMFTGLIVLDDPVRQGDGAQERAVGALDPVVLLLVDVLLEIPLALECEEVVLDGDLDVLLLDARQLGGHLIGALVLQDVDPRRPGPGDVLVLGGIGGSGRGRGFAVEQGREGAVEDLEGVPGVADVQCGAVVHDRSSLSFSIAA